MSDEDYEEEEDHSSKKTSAKQSNNVKNASKHSTVKVSAKNSKKPSIAASKKDEKIPESNPQPSAPEQVLSTRAYLESTVYQVVQEGMLELARKKPANPLEYLGNYILNRAKGK